MQSDDIPNTDIGFWLEYYVEVNGLKHCVKIYLLNLQSYLLNIAIIHLFSTTLDTQNKQQNICCTPLIQAGYSHCNTTTNCFQKGTCVGHQQQQEGREGSVSILQLKEGAELDGDFFRDLDLS